MYTTKTTTNFFFSQVLSIFLSITMFMSVCLCNVYVCQYRLIWQKAFFVVVDKRHWFRHLRLFFCWDKNFFLFCFSLIFFLLLLEESEIVSFCRSNKDVYIDDIVFFFLLELWKWKMNWHTKIVFHFILVYWWSKHHHTLNFFFCFHVSFSTTG